MGPDGIKSVLFTHLDVEQDQIRCGIGPQGSRASRPLIIDDIRDDGGRLHVVVSAIASSGVGSGNLTLNLDNTVSYDITFSGLTGTITVAHIHGPGAPGVPAGVVQGLTFISGVGATSGQLMGTTGAISPTQVADMLNGLHYVNIHSSFAGGGEIRGQILLVPEPTTLSLAALGGFAAFVGFRKVRRS